MMFLPVYPKQAQFLDSPSLYRAFIGGRGSGKSWVACYDLLKRARPNRTYLLASPTYPMLFDSELRTFERLARDLSALTDLKKSAPAAAKLRNGAEILFRSADDPERLRGPNLSGAVLMEAALMHRDAYDIAIACLREHGDQGWLSAATTPRGPSHWTAEVFGTREGTGHRPNTELFRATTRENPFNPRGFEDTLRQQYGDTMFARQELGGEFVAMEGAEFPAEWLTGEDLWFDAWPDNLVLKAIALDPSKGTDGKGKDFQAHVMIGVAVEGPRYVFYIDADLDRIGVVQMCDRTAELTKLFNAQGGTRLVDVIACEENSTLGLLQPALDASSVKNKVNLPYILRTNTDKKEFRIRSQIGPPLSRRQFRFRRTHGGRTLVGDLQCFPHGEFDDSIDALATGLRSVAELLVK